MPRRVTLVLMGALAAATAAVPAAQAAETYTVDGTAAPGCAAKVCRTLTDAVAAVAPGDLIVVQPGTYKEPGKVTLTKANVTIQGTPGKTTVYPAAGAAGDPTITLVQGDTLDGLTVATAADAGPAVLVTGRDATFQNGAILRLSPSTIDAPAFAVDPGVAAGTTTIRRATVVNGPPGQTTGAQPAILGNGTSTLAISDALVLSGAGTGPALALTGNDRAAGGAAVPNTVVRTSLIAQRAASSALTVTSAAADPLKKAVLLDSTSLLGGTSAPGLAVSTLSGGLPGRDTAGDVSVTADHVTVAGSDRPFAVSAASSGTPAAGNIAVTFDRSIVHGKNQGTVSSFTPAAPLPIPVLTGSANTAKVVISSSDTTQSAVGAPGDDANVTVPGKTTSPDAQLFVDLAKLDVHLRQDAPAIDRGGAAVPGESATDLDGQPRQTGAATDLGADEFLNRAPTASATATPTTAKQGDTVTFDGSKSSDPEAASGGGVVAYRWSFGDGSTQVTATPTVTHAFSQLGVFKATLTVVDNGGVASAPAAIPAVAVLDGVPPVVRITAPRPSQRFTVFVKKRVRRGSRIVTTTVLDPRRLAKVVFSGTAKDATPLRSVELSVRRVSVSRTTAAATTCVYLDGKTAFRSRSCRKPLYFAVQQKAGVFRYALKRALRVRAGVYEVSARATDAGGTVSAPVSVRFRLR